ncbi:MAG: hypothetical protein HY652_06065 [Acidobacteria bacterium]|nr:hypothetical protein [Acidobacteriota bacterium]
MYGSDRVLRGGIPAIDFETLYGPLLYYLTLPSYALLGSNLFSAYFTFHVASPLFSLPVIYGAGRFLLRDQRRRLLFYAACLALGLHSFFWTPAYRIWAGLLALGLLARSAERDRPSWALASGLTAGLTMLVSTEVGIATGAASALFLLGWTASRGWKATRSAFLLFLLGSASLLLPFAGLAAWRGRLLPLVRLHLELSRHWNWYAGLPFPEFGWRPARLIFYLPFAMMGLGVLFLLARAARKLGILRRTGEEQRYSCWGLCCSVPCLAARTRRTCSLCCLPFCSWPSRYGTRRGPALPWPGAWLGLSWERSWFPSSWWLFGSVIGT